MPKVKNLRKLPAKYCKASPFDKFLMGVKSVIFKATDLFQYVIALTIVIAIVLTFLELPSELGLVAAGGASALLEYLEYVVNAIIAIELIHVLTHQTLDSIVEILSMAITRELVLQHLHTYEILIGVLAIVLLFLMRKYLFISKLDDDADAEHRHYIGSNGSSGKKIINRNYGGMRDFSADRGKPHISADIHVSEK